MAAGDPTVTINVFAQTNQANQALGQVGANIRGVGDSSKKTTSLVGGMGKGLMKMVGAVAGLAAAYGGLRGAVGLMGQLVTVNMTFEDSMAQARSVTEQNAGFTEEAFKRMGAEARRLGATTKFSASQAAEGLKFLGMAGFTAEQATRSLAGTLQLAQAGNLELGNSADIVSNIMSAYGANASETGTYVDILAKTAATSNNSIQELGESMKFAAPISAGLGQSVHETAAAFAVLGQAGIKAGMSGAGLRMVMSQLTNSSSATVKTLTALGVAYEDIDPKANNLQTIFTNLKNAGVDVEGVFSAFDARAANVAQVLVRNADSLGEYTKRILDSKGAAETMAATMDNTFKGSVLRMKSAWQELLLTIGDSGVMNGLRGMLDDVSGVLAKVTQSVKTLKAVFESGELGELFKLSLQLASIQAVNFLLGGLVAAFNVATAYLLGSVSLLTSLDYWKNLWNIFRGAGMILVGLSSQLQSKLLEAVQPFAVGFLAVTSMIVDKLRAGFLVVATSFTSILLSGIRIVLEKLNKVSSIFGMDLDGAIESVRKAKENTDNLGEEAAASIFQTKLSDYEKGAESTVNDAITSLAKDGKEVVGNGLSTLAEGAAAQGEMYRERLVNPVIDAAKGFKPLNLFESASDGLEGKMAAVWNRGLANSDLADEEVGDAGAVKGKTAEEDLSDKIAKATKGSAAPTIASSLQASGGGGSFFGAATASLQSTSERSAKATEKVAENTTTLVNQPKTITIASGGGITPEVGSASSSRAQMMALMSRAVDYLAAIAANTAKNVGGSQINVSPA